MNILTLCLSPDLGGLELYALNSAKALSQTHKLLFITAKQGKLSEKLKQNNLNNKFLAPWFKPLPFFCAIKLANIIDDNKIDIIHMHWGKDLALASLAKRLSKRKPKLVYTRQMMITREKKDIYHRFLYSQLDLMLTITRQLETLCKQFLPGDHIKIETLYYGVNTPDRFLTQEEIDTQRKILGFNETDFIVGLFGRLEDNKGQHLLIKAVAQANKKGRNIKALIVGHEMNSGYRQELGRLAEEIGVSNKIIFHSFINNPQEFMQLCDCICLATHEETFGLVLAEAMRAGVAVIGSNKGGVLEIIEHDRTGLLFESGSHDSLSKRIAHLYDKPNKKLELASNGKLRADTIFSPEKHYGKLNKTLTTILNN